MEKTIKQDNEIMKLLSVNTINRIICNTEKGMLTLQIRKGESNYHLILDSVPLSDEDNKELMAILFPIQQVNFESKLERRDMSNPEDWQKTILVPKKKGGRPKVSKSK